jgi:VWFA-related protein
MARLFQRFWFFLLVIVSVTGAEGGRQQPAASVSPASSPQGIAPAESREKEKRTTVYESATVLKTITRLVVVDIVATSKKGEAVADLERSNFTVLEDGKEQTIRHFSFQQPKPVATGPAGAAPSASSTAKLPENVFSNAPRYAPDSALNVVLLDALNTTLPHQAYVRDQMIKFLGKMPQGHPIAVYALGSKLTLLQDFTSDPEALGEVVKKMKSNVSPLLDNAGGGPQEELLPPGAADSGLVPANLLQSIMQFDQERTSYQTDLRITYTLSALNAIARSLAGYPGRKNLIWVSEAFPISIDPNLELTGDIFAGTRNYQEQIADASDHLNDAQIAIYPVDARGLEAPSAFSAANSGRDRFGRGLNGPRLGTALSAEAAQLQNVHATMSDMAERTGGKAFYNRNDLDNAIRKSIDDGSTYYTLAYYPENKNWNGKFRKIQVTVNRPEVKVRHRLGYYAVDPKIFAEQNKKQQGALFGEAMNPDSPIATGLRFHAGVVQPSGQTQNKVLVNFGLDPHAISFDASADGIQHAQVDCVVQAYSGRGKLIKMEASTVTASLKPEIYNRVMESVFPCQQYIGLPPGSYNLRLGVRDDRTGLMGTTNAKVTVAETSTGGESTPPPDKK